MNENWYDDPTNVVALARWMSNLNASHGCSEYSDKAIVKMLDDPAQWVHDWQTYQATLKPKEPTLSEQAAMQGYQVDDIEYIMTQRIEALEAKVGER